MLCSTLICIYLVMGTESEGSTSPYICKFLMCECLMSREFTEQAMWSHSGFKQHHTVFCACLHIYESKCHGRFFFFFLLPRSADHVAEIVKTERIEPWNLNICHVCSGGLHESFAAVQEEAVGHGLHYVWVACEDRATWPGTYHVFKLCSGICFK